VALFLGQSIGIDQNNSFQLKCSVWRQNGRSYSFGRFVGGEWAWHSADYA